MATRSETAVKRIAVRLVKDPSNLSAAFPYGTGTELGSVRGFRLKPMEPVALVKAEEKGGRPVEGIRGGRYAILTCLLRGFDAAAISLLFPDSPGSGRITAEDPGTVGYPGALVTALACKILAAPETSGDPAIYFPRAIPLLAEEAEIPFQNREEAVIAVSFLALPDSSSRVYYVAPLANITL